MLLHQLLDHFMTTIPVDIAAAVFFNRAVQIEDLAKWKSEKLHDPRTYEPVDQ